MGGCKTEVFRSIWNVSALLNILEPSPFCNILPYDISIRHMISEHLEHDLTTFNFKLQKATFDNMVLLSGKFCTVNIFCDL